MRSDISIWKPLYCCISVDRADVTSKCMKLECMHCSNLRLKASPQTKLSSIHCFNDAARENIKITNNFG